MDKTIVSFAIFFILGIITGSKLPFNPHAIFAATCILWIIAAIIWKKNKPHVAHCLILVLIVLTGALRLQLSDPLRRPDSICHLIHRGRFNLELAVVSPVKMSYNNYRFQCEILSAEQGESIFKNPRGRILVTISGKPSSGVPVYGSRMRTAAIIEPHKAHYTSPWVNTSQLQISKGICGRVNVQSYAVFVGKTIIPSQLRSLLYKIRAHLQELLKLTHEERIASVLNAILFGNRDDLQPTLWEDFQRAGTIHLLAQSGLHTGILAMVVFITITGLRFGKKSASVITIVILFLYALMVGENSSVLRAALMISFIIAGHNFGKSPNPFTSMAAAAILLLAVNPSSLFLPGFQLSFVATTGILYLSPAITDALSFLPSTINSLISISLSSFLATAPLILYYSGSVSLAAPIANIFVLPLVGVIIPSSIFAMIGGLLTPWLTFFFGAANYGFVTLLIMVNQLFGSGLFPSFTSTTMPLPLFYGWYLILIAAGDRDLTGKFFKDRDISKRTVTDELLKREESFSPSKIDENLFSDFVHLSESDNTLEAILSSDRTIFFNQELLRLAATEGSKNLARELGKIRNSLSPKTMEYLLFSECWHISNCADNYTSPMAALLLAIEEELNDKVFKPFARATPADLCTTPELSILQTRGKLFIKEQIEILWKLSTPVDTATNEDIPTMKNWIQNRFRTPQIFTDATRLPLLLDEFSKRYQKNLSPVATISLGTFFQARESALGKGEQSILMQAGASMLVK